MSVTVTVCGSDSTVVVDGLMVRVLLIVPVMTSIGTAALLVPLHLTVTVA